MPAPTTASENSPVDVELETLIRARYPIIYVVSWEERRVEETLREICQRRGKKMLLWTYTTGMAGNVASRDPLAALDYVMSAPDQSVFVFKDFHPFIADVAVTRRLRDLVYALKTSYKTLIILSPLLKLPPELEKEITVVDYQLPTLRDLDRLLEGIIQSVRANGQIKTDLTPLEREQIIKAASGLTSNEAENVFAKSLVETRGFDIDVILGEKEQIIRKSGILEYYRASEAFADVGGMDLLKNWMTQRTASFNDDAKKYGLPEPKGILLLGVQGCGKSLTAKAIASLWRLPLLRLDVGKIFAGIVGSSEENMRRAISTAESVAPCVSGDTQITLWGGAERTIEDLYNDRNVASLDVVGMSDDFNLVQTRVQAVTRRTAPDLFAVKLRHGVLRATSNHLHPVLHDGTLCWTRTDALQVGDHVAMPRRIPTRMDSPSLAEFLPAETRLYCSNALAYARPGVRTSQRCYAARARNADYVRLSELQNSSHFPAFDSVERFAVGRGGTADSTLTNLPETLTGEIAYLCGLIASDGFHGKAGRTGFVNTDLSLHARFGELMQQCFGVTTKTRLNEKKKMSLLSGLTIESVFKPCYTTYVNNSLLARLLLEIKTRILEMPSWFLESYVRGYFDGDGCVSDPATAEPKITITAKIPVGNRELRAVLQRIGFLTANPPSANIEITGRQNVLRFITQIGSDHPSRSVRMQSWLCDEDLLNRQTKDRSDVVPVGTLLRATREACGMKTHHFDKTSGSLVARYETGAIHPSRARLNSLLEEMGVADDETGLARLVNGPIAWSPILSVTREETPEYVYDLVCEKTHNFVANGVVTHNCVLWIDEMEKGFAGTQSSPFSDGGTTSRVFGSFINWLQEKKAPCFVVATSNDVSQLPPELMRKGRFDEIFFVDLPAAPERSEIFAIHLRKRKRDPETFDLKLLGEETSGFSGAEIEQVVVDSLVKSFNDGARELTTDDIVKTAADSIPLSVTMREGIQRLREWADTRARPASSETAETTEELAEMRAEDERERRRMPPPPQSRLAVTSPVPSEYEMEVERDVDSRLAALERKTATGLDNVMHELPNEVPQHPPTSIAPPAMPVEETQGTDAPVTGAADNTTASTETA